MLVRALMGLWFLFSLTGSAQAMDNPYRLLTSTELPEFFANTLPVFWQQHAQPGEFSGVDGVPIRYVALRNPVGHKAILVVNGRLESYIKYQELAYELFQQGYSVYLYDHRGQGFSGRMLSDPQKGYVQRFADYVTDLKSFPRSGSTRRPAKPALPAFPLHGWSHCSPLSGTVSPGRQSRLSCPPPCSASSWVPYRPGWLVSSPG